MEKLDFITLELKYAKPLDEIPYYSESDKKIIAWSIAFEGSIGISKQKRRFAPNIRISNIEFENLTKFMTIVKLGQINKEYKATTIRKEARVWNVNGYRAVAFILREVIPFIPSRRKRKVAELVLEFCESRLRKHDNKLDLSYDQRELEIYEETKRLNKLKVL